ncbi:MAG TPA: PBP1A family penicillin-binding protein [Desulfobacteraceae bacterium]|nr:PBP1A family penicillin-binding protein [Desulfobacteraceae bacterium]
MTARKKPTKRPARRPAKRSVTRNHTHIIIFLMIICGLVTLGIGTGLAWFLSLNLPDIRSVDDYRPLVTTTLLDRGGRTIGTICRENRILLSYRKMPPLLPKAFVAAEDSRYWEHGALDGWSIFRAFINNLRSGRRSQGGSTITQQVTRALMLSRKKSYLRKAKEAILSYRLDNMLSKKAILTIYLNEIYLGEGAYGVEAAARTYFGKKARQLNLAEIALLAGLPQSPSRYSPLKHFDQARARQRYVLNRMAEDGVITPGMARRAYHRPLHFYDHNARREKNGYFTEYVRQQLEQRYGRKRLLHQGLTVTTTLDSTMQAAAVKAVLRGAKNVQKHQHNRFAPQGALVALDSRTGNILAMVGGTDYSTSPYNRAVQARRQPGSVFKPLIYAAAFEKGISPNLTIEDVPLSIHNPDGSFWRPHNYSRRNYGPTSLRDALVFSRNIVTIKLLQKTGLRPVIRLAARAGIRSPLQPELPLALGASPVSLLEMTGAYTVFADNGLFHPPVCITCIRDRRGHIQPWPGKTAKRVIKPETARQITAILHEVISRGTGKNARGIPDSAGKTGTTDNNMDSWFIGYTPAVTTGVWLGYDRGRSLGRGETGGRTAAPVWLDFMRSRCKPPQAPHLHAVAPARIEGL